METQVYIQQGLESRNQSTLIIITEFQLPNHGSQYRYVIFSHIPVVKAITSSRHDTNIDKHTIYTTNRNYI